MAVFKPKSKGMYLKLDLPWRQWLWCWYGWKLNIARSHYRNITDVPSLDKNRGRKWCGTANGAISRSWQVLEYKITFIWIWIKLNVVVVVQLKALKDLFCVLADLAATFEVSIWVPPMIWSLNPPTTMRCDTTLGIPSPPIWPRSQCAANRKSRKSCRKAFEKPQTLQLLSRQGEKTPALKKLKIEFENIDLYQLAKGIFVSHPD